MGDLENTLSDVIDTVTSPAEPADIASDKGMSASSPPPSSPPPRPQPQPPSLITQPLVGQGPSSGPYTAPSTPLAVHVRKRPRVDASSGGSSSALANILRAVRADPDPKQAWNRARHAVVQRLRTILLSRSGEADEVRAPSSSSTPIHTTVDDTCHTNTDPQIDFCACPKPAAGVSFVVASESAQAKPLPHLVYRPPVPKGATPPDPAAVAAFTDALLHADTLAATFVLKDEAAMKAYCLHPMERVERLRTAAANGRGGGGGGSVVAVVGGAAAVPGIVPLRFSFSALHYRLKQTRGGELTISPCLPPGGEGNGGEGGEEKGNEAGGVEIESARSALESSNFIVGAMVKRGVGGTYPLRCAAKRMQGVLSLVMDDEPPAVVEDEDTEEEGGGGEGGGEQGEEGEPAGAAGEEGGAAGGDSGGSEAAAATVVLPAHQRLTLQTVSCRFEVYIDESTFKALDAESRAFLHAVAVALEAAVGRVADKRNADRLAAYCRDTILTPSPSPPDSESQPLAPDIERALDKELSFAAAGGFAAATVAAAALAAYEDTAAPLCGDVTRGDETTACESPTSPRAVSGPRRPLPPLSLYFIGTRDHFTHQLVSVDTQMTWKDASGATRSFTKSEWFFQVDEAPGDYRAVLHRAAPADGGAVDEHNEDDVNGATTIPSPSTPRAPTVAASSCRLLPAGLTTYNGVFSAPELSTIESHCDALDARRAHLPHTCLHSSYGRGGALKRTKYFFGARYLWTRDQLAAPGSSIAHGVRIDVPPPPSWVATAVTAPLAAAAVLPPSRAAAIDSVALNVYHDGSEGLQSHYDDPARFDQPIHSLRLFSDCRLSFGTTLFGYSNGAFVVPMPRGCVTVMEEGGYAANGAKHCIRPVDLMGKSASLLLRKMAGGAMKAAKTYFVNDTVRKLERLSLEPYEGGGSDGEWGDGGARRGRRGGGMYAGDGRGDASKYKRRGGNGYVQRRSVAQEVARLMAAMVGGVEEVERRQQQAAAAGLDIESVLVDAEVYGVVHDMVSFCQVVGGEIGEGRGVKRGRGRGRKPAI